jgi:predicted amidophosphoribosyltransferase
MDCDDIDYIFPIPLHKSKLKIRGYNQSAIIAKMISKITKIKYDFKIFIKIKSTPNQSGLPRDSKVLR